VGLTLAFVLYAVSFILPAIALNRIYLGWEAFLIVPQLLLESPPQKGIDLALVIFWWLPNPALWLGTALMSLRRWTGAAVVGLAGVLGVAACGFEPDGITFDYHAFSIGYYCWATSIALMTALAFWRSATSTSQGKYPDGGTYLNAPPSTFNEPSSPPTR
jgi:hypothetical protein